MPDREKRTFWYANEVEATVKQVTGLSCPGYPNSWWIRSLGMTVHIGHQLFDTKREALLKVQDSLRHGLALLNRQRERVERELAEEEERSYG